MALGPIGFAITGENLVPLSSFLKNSTSPATAVRLSTSEVAAGFAVIQARVNNDKNIVIGSSDILASTHQGIEMEPGEKMGVSTRELKAWYLDVTTSGDGVSVTIFG